MADTKNLPLDQPQKEVKKAHPTSVLGGAMGWLDEIGEVFLRGQGVLVNNEGPVTGQDLEQLSQMSELKPGRLPARGSFENFQEPRTLMTDEDLIDEQRAVIEAERIVRQNQARSYQEFIQNEEIRFEVEGMSEEERNRRLHLNLSLRKEHTQGKPYYEVELYRQKKEEFRTAQREEQSHELEVQQQPVVDLNAVLEGGLGKGKAHISPISSAG